MVFHILKIHIFHLGCKIKSHKTDRIVSYGLLFSLLSLITSTLQFLILHIYASFPFFPLLLNYWVICFFSLNGPNFGYFSSKFFFFVFYSAFIFIDLSIFHSLVGYFGNAWSMLLIYILLSLLVHEFKTKFSFWPCLFFPYILIYSVFYYCHFIHIGHYWFLFLFESSDSGDWFFVTKVLKYQLITS